jgi:hypothetical protein
MRTRIRSPLAAVALLTVGLGLLGSSSAWAQEILGTPLPEAPNNYLAAEQAAAMAISYQDGGYLGGGYQGGGCVPWEYGNPDLFYNFYQNNNCGGAPAAMYLAPRPVPPMVGHTYYTYQPFMPHELLYPHHRTYRNWYDGGRGLTRAHATWYRSPITTVVKGAYYKFRLPR